MGSQIRKHIKGTKFAKSTKVKERVGKNISRNVGSTQSLNVNPLEVSFRTDVNKYSQIQVVQPFTQHQSLEDLNGRVFPTLRPRTKPPPVPAKKEMSRLKESKEAKKDNLSEKKKTEISDCVELDSRPKVRADRNYEANYESDISFRKGDILQLINEGEVNGWYFGRNLTTEKEGYVPKNWVTMINSSVGVESQKCFFKEMKRDEAEKKLLEPGIEHGTYLLRPSENGYSLSLRCKSELYELEIRHYRVRVVDKGECIIDADANRKTFSSIEQLIKFYTEKPGLRCMLKTPLPQEVPLDDLAVKFSNLKLGEQIGSGNFSTVYAGTLHGNKQVAVKSLKAASSMTVEEFRKEAETMHKLRHPNLVSLLAICETNGNIYIITERMSKGALLILLREEIDNAIGFKDLMDMAIQVAEGMCYLEKKAFVHRDLRAANVLVGDGNITKIADFGLARLLDNYYEHEEFYKVQKGTGFPVKWTAPEAAKKEKFTVKSDVWSFGILLYEIVTYGEEPYAGMANHEVIRYLDKENENRLERPTKHHCPLALYNIMKQCWLENSKERPNFADIKDNLIEIKTNG